jgi:two-component system cell cycle sensor histidine kinase/response regulator CckA
MKETLHIVMIEDVPSDALLVEESLRAAGFVFKTVRVTTRNGFLDEIGNRPPDIILSDYTLPQFDGMEALRLAKERHPAVPFIMVTGTIDEETAVECIKSGADDYVLKNHLGRRPNSVHSALGKRRALREKQEAEKALRESEIRYRRLFESAREGVLLLDAETRLVTDVNPYMAGLMGVMPISLHGKTLLEIGLIPDRKSYDALMHQIDSSGAAGFDGTLAAGQNGTKVAIEMNCHAYDMQDRRLIQCNVRDMTERRQSEEEKETMRAQLFQAQKMEAIGNLAGGVAHDFNNLMTAIQVSADVGMMKVDESNLLFMDLKEIRYAALRASSLIRQLLLFSRKHPMEFTFLSINGIVENLIKMLHRLIGEDIQIKTELDAKLWTVRADASNMEQVVMNLSLNARDAMPKGGTLTIRTENVLLKQDAAKTMPESRPGKFVCLSILDTGVGMDYNIIQRIFEPFFTTKGPGRGTGLGLSVVYGIVKQHDGWIHVISKPGKGSAFKLYLPAFSEEAEDKTEQKVQLETLRGKGQLILLVEDEEKVRESARTALEKCGYRVLPVRDVKEALETFRKEQGRFDLVFSDVVLSDGTGIELAEELLALKPDVKILLSSGYTDQKSQWPIIREKGYRFLQKPYTLADLLKSIQAAVE